MKNNVMDILRKPLNKVKTYQTKTYTDIYINQDNDKRCTFIEISIEGDIKGTIVISRDNEGHIVIENMAEVARKTYNERTHIIF